MNNNQGRSPAAYDPAQRGLLLRIDNLPPGKSWKEVRYLIGGIIHHSNVLQVKMLPLMSSIVPPFVPFQSCLVTLKASIDGDSLSDLLVSLNTYQWDYYNLYAYTLPPMDVIHQFMPAGPPPMVDGLGSMHTRTDGSPTSSGASGASCVSGVSGVSGANGAGGASGVSSASNTPTMLYPTPLPGHTPGSAAAAAMLGPPLPGTTGMPPLPHPSLMSMGPGPPRRQYYESQIYSPRKFGSVMGPQIGGVGPSTGGSRNCYRSGGNFASERYLMVGGSQDLVDHTPRGPHLNGNNSRRLKQIFNEKTFRKQMTGRGMSQLQLSNFPPFLKLDSLEPIDAENYTLLKERGMQLMETDQPEKYSRLRWTVLKDYIKLKCPGLLNQQQQPQQQPQQQQEEGATSARPQDGSGVMASDSESPPTKIGNNTREFYVGVYEDHEEPIDLKILPAALSSTSSSNAPQEPQYCVAPATVYKAIVGFNNNELCERCMEALNGQEYSLGYQLKVRELPPYEEEQRSL